MEGNCRKNLLITSLPGIGKTTLVKKIAHQIQDLHPIGFYSQEMRDGGNRVGFELVGFDGRTRILAHLRVRGSFRVGKYGIDIEGFERFLSGIGIKPDIPYHLIIIDEIGRMECYSKVFRRMVDDFLNSDRLLLATISMKGDSYIDRIKRRDDVKLFQVTRENRDELIGIIVREIRLLM